MECLGRAESRSGTSLAVCLRRSIAQFSSSVGTPLHFERRARAVSHSFHSASDADLFKCERLELRGSPGVRLSAGSGEKRMLNQRPLSISCVACLLVAGSASAQLAQPPA